MAEKDYTYSIQWECYTNEDGWDAGATLGENPDDGTRSEDGIKAEDVEHEIACVAVAQAIAVQGMDVSRDSSGWRFASLREANRALASAKSALKAHRDGRPMPEWAKTAIAAGWKPPRGWHL